MTGCRSRASAPSTGSYVTWRQSTPRCFSRPQQQVRSTRCLRCRCSHCATAVVCTRHCDIVPAGRATWPPLVLYSGQQSRGQLRRRCLRRRRRHIVTRTTRRATWTAAQTQTATTNRRGGGGGPTTTPTPQRPTTRSTARTPDCQSASTASDSPITQ